MRRALVLALILALPGAARAEEAVDVKWTLKEGATFYSKTTIVQKQTMTILGQSVDVTMDVTSALRYKVKSVQQGTAVVEVTYLESIVEVKGLPIAGLGEMGKKAKGTVVTLTIDDKGQIAKVEGAGKIAEKFADAEGIEKELGPTLYAEAIVTELVGVPFTILPGKPVKSGDTWAKDEKQSPGGFDVTGKTTYKVDEVANGFARISTKGDLKVKLGPGGAKGLPFKISKADLKVEKATSAYEFDLKAGRLTELTQTMIISGDLTIALDGNDITIGMTAKQSVKVAISDRAPVLD